MRILLDNDPFALPGKAATMSETVNTWPAKWIKVPFAKGAPALVAFRCIFSIKKQETAHIHISADERYQLFLDGQSLGRGPDLGDQENWYYDTYQLTFTPGEHVLVARVLMINEHRQTAQITLAHGLLVCPDPDSPFVPLIATGIAQWSCKVLDGYTICGHDWSLQATGPMTLDTHEFPWGYETGQGDGWLDAVYLQEASIASTVMEYNTTMHLLRPAVIPPQIDRTITGFSVQHVGIIRDFNDNQQPFTKKCDLVSEHEGWNHGVITIPAHTVRRVLIRFDDYFSFYYSITVSGGKEAKIRIAVAERLLSSKGSGRSWKTKTEYDEMEGAFFDGPSDQFILDGGGNRKLEPFWWRCGRYVQIVVMTDDQPLTISQLEFRETRYPLELQSSYDTSDTKWNQILPISFRTLQECCHDIYVDCPYYEQQQWVGDMRIQMLCHYVATGDVRQIKKALTLVNNSAAQGGFFRAFYPSDSRLLVPGFALWYIASVYDFALWRGEKEFVRTLMPQVRSSMDSILQSIREDGLIAWPQGWPFTDWATGFTNGNPPAGGQRTESIFNFQTVHVLDMLADIETYLDEGELAARWHKKAQTLAEACRKAFWDSSRGLFSIDLAHEHFSEHSQCMAVLSGRITPEQEASIKEKMVSDSSMTHVQMFYSYYLFSVYSKLGLIDTLFSRMTPWYKMLEMNLKTTPETDFETRSDCHAWSAHPLFHFYTTILGIRPASMEFATVEIIPQLGKFSHASGKLVHPVGFIEAEFFNVDGKITGSISLPKGVTGTAKINGQILSLREGTQRIS